jgi:tryptophanyl-tRNA synthetase
VHNDPADLIANVRTMAAALIAAGVDPAKSVLFNQARVPAHAELAWVLNGTARIGWLNRMTQFKDKAGKNREGASVGLYTYPVLMAADVLLYRATHVPVGDDQKQHLELARDVATKFNLDFNTDLFPLPDPIIPPAAARIMSLRDGMAKMSKSDPSDMSRVNLTDDSDMVAAKIRKAKTDPEPLPADPADLVARPEARNLVGIYAALADESAEQVLARFAGQGFGAFKPALADLLVETLRPIKTRLDQFASDPAALDRLLDEGAARAREEAAPTLEAAYRAVGLSR